MFNDFIKFVKELYATDDGIIPLHAPCFNGNEKKYLLDCIDSTYVSSVGSYVNEFEKQVAEFTGAKYAIATVNGTAALHIALILAGVNKGDEVLTQPLTFVATCNAISYCGANPVFIDVDRKTLGMCPESLERFFSENTNLKSNGCYNKKTGAKITAVVPMHTFGHPCRIDEIHDICAQYKTILVEDAAESLGSYYKNKHTGTFGRIGALSFNGNKIITTGGGGMILTDDEELGKRAKHLTTTAKVTHAYEYIHNEIGYNYRMPNINAALGCAQMENIKIIIRKKKELANDYADFFKLNNGCFFMQPKDCNSNYWLNTLVLQDERQKNEFLRETNNLGVLTRPVWRLLNRLEMYKNCQCTDLVNSVLLESRVVNIPSSIRL